jgi:hypothetical protein
MSIDYEKFEPEDAETQSRWGRELVTTHLVSLKTGGCPPPTASQNEAKSGAVGAKYNKTVENWW